MNRKGFTLTELMITVAIIGILVAVALPNYMVYKANSRMTEAKTNLAEIGIAALSYKTEYGTYKLQPGSTLLGFQSIGRARYDYWYDKSHVGFHDPVYQGGGDHSVFATTTTFLASAAGDVADNGADSDQWTYNQDRFLAHLRSGL